ncbi:MAG: hypothetical protein ACFFEK_07015 [Candidatus Thorarchaeota archaeon]
MKQKIPFAIMFTIVMLNALASGANITVTPEYRLDSTGIDRISYLSQEEYNISSYKNYLDATLDLMMLKHLNMTTGVVFHSVTYDLSAYSVETSLSNYYWAIAALSRAYDMTNNETYSIVMSRVANKMVSLFKDPTYPGFYVNEYSDLELRQTKRPGVQAYAYQALEIAESTNASLDFTVEKESALICLTDMLYDPVYGGFYFYTMRNGSLSVPSYFSEVYPNDGKRLDHLALAIMLLYDVGQSSGNTTLVNMADQSTDFMLRYMNYSYSSEFMGLKLAVSRSGGYLSVEEGDRVAHSIVTDINAIAIRALIKGYEITGNTTYLGSANAVFEALFANNWDGDNGGWFAEVVDGEPYDPLNDEDVKYYKYSEIQFQMIMAMEDLYEITGSIYPIRIVIDTLELVLTSLWDHEYEGFVSNSNQIWQVFAEDWEVHYTAVQTLAIISLDRVWSYGLPIVTRVRITPTNPRPEDNVYFSATAFDDDGIDSVYVNYSLRVGSNTTHGILPLIPHPTINGLYNNSLGTLANNSAVNFEVVANDTTGQVFVAGIYFFFVRTDNFAPTATLYAIYPSGQVRVGDDVIIDMETYEFPLHSSTNSCEIWWRLNAGAYNVENMTPIGFDGDSIVWRIELGQFEKDDKIAFFCLVEDESGNVGESRLYILTILGPAINVTPFTTFQIVATVGLIAAPGVGYAYVKMRKVGNKEVQREGKKAARKRARRRGSRRRR